jgi:hypothetical protein
MAKKGWGKPAWEEAERAVNMARVDDPALKKAAYWIAILNR